MKHFEWLEDCLREVEPDTVRCQTETHVLGAIDKMHALEAKATGKDYNLWITTRFEATPDEIANLIELARIKILQTKERK